ncbi:MAG: type IV pili twitching motility protein PilT, partial [Myxococcota bacterium]
LEILRNTARVRELIEDKDRTKELSDAIGKGHTTYGMQTFDQSLMKLFQNRTISYEEALRQATNADDFALRVSGVAGTSDSSWEGFDASPTQAAPRHTASTPRRTPQRTTTRRAAPEPKPATVEAGDDDFTIERF